MPHRPDVVIVSPCTFMRAGLEVACGELACPPRAVVARLPDALAVLLSLSRETLLVLHVAAPVRDDDWRRFDTVLALCGPQVHTVILHDPDSVSTLAHLPYLMAQAAAVRHSGVTRRDLVACLQCITALPRG